MLSDLHENAYMENNTSLAALIEPFRSGAVEGIEVAIRREGDELKIVVACRSSREMHEIEGTCSDGECGVLLSQIFYEAIAKATGTPREYLRQSAALSHASVPAVTEGTAKKLSDREKEVLRLLAGGDTNKKIGMKLGISVHTVNAHRVSIMSKLDIHDAQGLTRFAAQHGLIDVHRR